MKPLLAVLIVAALVLTACSATGKPTGGNPPVANPGSGADNAGTPGTPGTSPTPYPGIPPSSNPSDGQVTTPPVTNPPGENDPPAPLKREKTHVDVKGIYLTGYTAGSDKKFNELLEFVKSTGLNAMVIDAKDDDGRISWITEIPLAKEIGSNTAKIRDIRQRIKTLEENGIYSIARIVVFADPLLSQKRPEMAILGAKWKDRRGISWTDPNNKDVWQYNVDIAKAAAEAGFREIQFDYIRFPEKDIPGVTQGVSREKRVGAILGFLEYAKQELEPYNVFMSVDVFGLTTSVAIGDDMKLGQDYAEIAKIADYISPMIYPSHYALGTYGLPNPNKAPFETVYNSMVKAQQRTFELPVEKHRPWIQDFSLGHPYGVPEVEAQIKGLAKAGIYTFILWDPRNTYTVGVNYNIAPKSTEEPEWKKQYREELARKAEEEKKKQEGAQPPSGNQSGQAEPAPQPQPNT